LAENLDTARARADLFDKKLFCLMPSERSSDRALNLAVDLATAMGAQPFFMDPVEHDGLAAVVSQLPMVMAGALMSIANSSSGWGDMRKLAGSQFYSSTWLAEDDPKGMIGTCLANEKLLTHWIGRLIDELELWKEQLAAGAQDDLAMKLEAGQIATAAWVRAQAQGNWEEPLPMADLPTSGVFMRQMIGLGGMGRRPEKPKK
jgi:prephenate dehydrogenase